VVIEPDAPGDSASRAAVIRGFLLQQLPEYMVPSTYVEIPALPLNHNLKIDRKALPDPPPQAPRRDDAPAWREPQTASEQRLAALWREILGVTRVGLDDNFFDLGGSSLLALRLISDVDRELGVTLTGLESCASRSSCRRSCASGAWVKLRARQAPERSAAAPTRSSYFISARAEPVRRAARRSGQDCRPRRADLRAAGHEYFRAHFICSAWRAGSPRQACQCCASTTTAAAIRSVTAWTPVALAGSAISRRLPGAQAAHERPASDGDRCALGSDLAFERRQQL